ncbi:MAG: copper chaperone PCu(A)C [Xanthobacteraceae bacterium]
MKILATIALGVTTLAAHTASAHDYKLGALQIDHPWARATPKGTSVGGGYLKITNTGTTPDRLIGGSSPIAGRFEIHEMSMDNGVMRMRPLKDGLEIKPGQTVELAPGSFHIMFVDLKQPIKEGDRVKGTLVFEKAGSVDVEYAAVGVGAMPKGGSQPAHGMQNHGM